MQERRYAYFASKQDLQLATIDCARLVFEEHVLAPGGSDCDLQPAA